MIKAEQRENGGVQIVNMHLVLDGGGAEFIRGAVGHAAPHAAAGQHGGKCLGIVVPAGVVAAIAVAGGFAAEFAAPDNQRFIKEIALLQVLDERRQRLVNVLRARSGRRSSKSW
jgi:hypothetical protein